MIIPKAITPATLTASLATYYTAPALSNAILKNLTFCNTTAGAVAVSVTIGGKYVWKAKTLLAGETKECVEAINQVLPAAGIIQASGLDVDITGSVLEQGTNP